MLSPTKLLFHFLLLSISLLPSIATANSNNNNHYGPSSPPSSSSNTLTTWEQIHQTLHTYPLAIDLKNPSLFPAVFAPDAFANYTGPLSNLTGLTAITTALQASVAKVLSQHLLGTTVIDITGPTTANSTTYVQATLVGLGSMAGEVVYLYGYYSDSLVRLDQGWRIQARYLVFLAPFIGNVSLLGG